MKFANIIFDRNERLTIGDDVQLLAIQNCYKGMGIREEDIVRIPFHELADWSGDYVVLPVSFPLYGFHTDMRITQFSPKIIPVFLGLSLLSSFISDAEVDYLRRFAPIGCRDGHTLRILQKYGIPCWLNSCMTLTLPRRDSTITGDRIYCIDVQESFLEYIPKDIREKAVFTSHTYYPEECLEGAEQKAREVYEEYRQHARLIITSRMHGALPNVAAGIPVILVKDKLSFRFLGLNQLVHVYTKGEWRQIDWNPQPIVYEELKKAMLENAQKRIWEQYNKYTGIYTISEFFEEGIKEEYYIEFVTNTINFLKDKFKEGDTFFYILWGVTQTAETVYQYILEHYPKAKLIGVIDKKKRLCFHGIDTGAKEMLQGKKQSWCFVCTGAAIKESYQYFEELGHERFYQCCEDGSKHTQELRYHNSYENVLL